jgi:hypothetical protein
MILNELQDIQFAILQVVIMKTEIFILQYTASTAYRIHWSCKESGVISIQNVWDGDIFMNFPY